MQEELQNTGEIPSEAAAHDGSVQDESQIGQEQSEEQNVPLSALQAERAHRQNIQEELKMIKDHVALMQANQTQVQQTPQKDEFDGISDDDVLTVGEAKKFLGKLDKQYQTNIEELRMTQRHPDYREIVTKYLPEVIKANPNLRRTLEMTQDFELAYHLAKNSDAYKADNKTTKRNADAERLVQNANRAGSLSSVGSTSPMSEAKRWKDMSDEDFMKASKKNLGYF